MSLIRKQDGKGFSSELKLLSLTNVYSGWVFSCCFVFKSRQECRDVFPLTIFYLSDLISVNATLNTCYSIPQGSLQTKEVGTAPNALVFVFFVCLIDSVLWGCLKPGDTATLLVSLLKKNILALTSP